MLDPDIVTPSPILALSVALGIGLLVGAERERRKQQRPQPSAAGIRTFAVASLMGAVAMLVGGPALLSLVVLIAAVSAMLAYKLSHHQDPGLTTELALVLTCLLGGMAVQDAWVAAGIGVLLAGLLAARQTIHHFVKNLLTEQDLRDALIFASIALIALPLAPNRFMGPFDALNPNQLVTLVVAAMAISVAGYVGTRWLGPRYGLPLAGFASGFVSSTATIHAMGQRAVANPKAAGPAAAGAVLSSIATMIQMSVLVTIVQPQLLAPLAAPLLMGSIAAVVFGFFALWRSRSITSSSHSEAAQERAFTVKHSVGFALVLGTVMTASAALNAWLGDRGLILSALIGGLADAHAAAASTASLMSSGKIQASQAVLPILLGLTANTITKAVVALQSGGLAYARQIIPGLVLMIIGVWAGYILVGHPLVS